MNAVKSPFGSDLAPTRKQNGAGIFAQTTDRIRPEASNRSTTPLQLRDRSHRQEEPVVAAAGAPVEALVLVERGDGFILRVDDDQCRWARCSYGPRRASMPLRAQSAPATYTSVAT